MKLFKKKSKSNNSLQASRTSLYSSLFRSRENMADEVVTDNKLCEKEAYYQNILETIGSTPLVKLNKIPKDHGLECEFFVKCEYMNPGGSIKDRIANAMVKDAIARGHATPCTRFVEPTSGNTGIGVALVATVYGNACTVVTTDKSSDDKINTCLDLGSEVILTPHTAPYGDPRNFISVAKKIEQDDPNALLLDQFSNEVNPQTHYEHTSEEILKSLKYFDMAVMGAGTGGTITGVARRLKEVMPKCVTVAVDPLGSTMFDGGEFKPYLIEGIGSDFVPKVLDKSVVDMVIHPTDKEAFIMARELIKKEGLLCGGSSGAAMVSAIHAVKKLKFGAGKRVVVILPDGIRNYMNKFVCDQWMEAYLFKELPERDFMWWTRSIYNLDIDTKVPCILDVTTCIEALRIMGTEHDCGLVVNEAGYLKGVVSKRGLRYYAANPRRKGETFDFTDPVKEHLNKTFFKIIENKGNPTVGLASRILDIASIAVVVEEITSDKSVLGYIPKGIITSNTVLEFIIKHQKNL